MLQCDHVMFENQGKQDDARGWEVKLMFFNGMVVQVLVSRYEGKVALSNLVF